MNRTDTVTASEFASWAYCPESFGLASLDHESANQLARDEGHAHHAAKATAERRAGGVIAFGFRLIVMGLLTLAMLWWLQR